MVSAIDYVRRFRALRVLVIGDAMLDTYYEGTAARLCSEGPVPVVRKTSEYRAPGGAANVAANLAALGAEALFVGAIGQDIAGTLLRTALRERQVEDRWLVADRALATLHKLRILADGQYVVRFDEEASRRLPTRVENALVQRVERLLPTCDLVVLSDYCYGVVTDALLTRLRELRCEHPCVLYADSKQLQRFPKLGASVVKPNLLEARLLAQREQPPAPLSGATHETRDEAEQLGRYVLSCIETDYVALTMAGEGVCLVGRDGTARRIPAHPVEHASDVGAGDSFGAAMALALGAGAPPDTAARIGVEAAAVAVTKRWTAVVQHQELLQRVSVRDHATQPYARIPATEGAARDALALLMARLATERKSGRTVVFTNGVFDILHAGHVEFLRQAKALGDVLVVGVNSDRSARKLKGAGRPINGEDNRLALVAALDAVDHAVLFDDDTPAGLIRALRPHIHVKGGDYAGATLPEAEAVAEVGGRLAILPLVGGHSTSDVIDRIAALTEQQRTEPEARR